METITIGGREITLEFTAYAFEQICDDEELDGVTKFKQHIEGKGWMRRTAKYIAYLGNAHLRKQHMKADLTPDWILDNAYPKEMRDPSIRAAVASALFDGMVMQSDMDSDEEVDVYKQENEKKEQTGCR